MLRRVPPPAPEAGADELPSPLEERLITLIKANGPMTVADYMSDALFHPQYGYYTSQSPFGTLGDFTTSPEISQIFGELIGLWLVQSWIDMGEPDFFHLVELGPGRGVLMEDIIRASAIRPEFKKAARIWLVETSGRLRHEQQKRLRHLDPEIAWKDRLEDVPEGPLLLVANEMLDCLPVRQFIMTEDGWRERMVNVNETGDALAFSTAFAPPLNAPKLPPADDYRKGDIFELCQPANDLTEAIASRVTSQKGRALIVDYGHIRAGAGDTLQAVKNHASWPVLRAPGTADITAHVNFSQLTDSVFDCGAAAHGPLTQGDFLRRLGLETRVAKLSAGKPEHVVQDIQSAAFRICAPSQMGEIFKALCISSPGLATPAAFDPR